MKEREMSATAELANDADGVRACIKLEQRTISPRSVGLSSLHVVFMPLNKWPHPSASSLSLIMHAHVGIFDPSGRNNVAKGYS